MKRRACLPARAGTIRSLSARMVDGQIAITRSGDTAATIAALQRVPGIGDWTAQYVAMRALGRNAHRPG